jgi:hypothetical protein
MINIENADNDNIDSSTFVVVFATEDNQTLTISRDGTDIHTATLNLNERVNIIKLAQDTITIDNALIKGTNNSGEFVTYRRVEDDLIRAYQIS